MIPGTDLGEQRATRAQMPVGVGQAQHLTQAPPVSAKVATTDDPAATPAEDTLADVGAVLSVTSKVVVLRAGPPAGG